MGTKSDDELGRLLQLASTQEHAIPEFLTALADASVLVLLHREPGEGAAEPQRNLFQLQRADGERFVPLFTAADQLPGTLPPPGVMARVTMRTLLTTAGGCRYLMNPLSTSPWELTPDHLAVVRWTIEQTGRSMDFPRRDAPWAFRAAPDALFPVARALAESFITSGRVGKAFLYQLERTADDGSRVNETVLGIDEAPDIALALALARTANDAGLVPGPLVVRFLPEEPSHAAGLEGMGLEPFYRRPPCN